MSILLELPIAIIQRTHLTSLQPSGNTMEVKCVITHSPSHGTLFGSHRSLIGLAFNAQIHDVIPANSAIVDNDIPGPQSDCVPLLDLESENKVNS